MSLLVLSHHNPKHGVFGVREGVYAGSGKTEVTFTLLYLPGML